MAFVNNENQQEEEEKKGSQPSVVSSGQGSAIGSGTGAPASGGATGGSGQFTNLQSYIKANQPKTQQLAEGITGDVKKQGEALKTDIGQKRESYLGEQGKFGEGQKQFVQQQVSQAGQQPQSQEDVDRFRSLATGAEKAPDLTEQRGQAQDLQRRAKEFETSKGRFEGLNRLVGGKTATYGKGQKQLDQLLLAGDRQSKQKSIRDMREATKGLDAQVGQLGTDVNEARQATQQQAQEAITNARTAAQEEARNRYESLRGGLEAGQLSQEQLTQLGLEAGQRTYGADLLGGLEQTRGMSAQDTARLDALAKLGGLEGRELYTGIQGGDTAQNLQEMIAQRQGAYESALTPLQQQQQQSQAAQQAIDAYLGSASSNAPLDPLGGNVIRDEMGLPVRNTDPMGSSPISFDEQLRQDALSKLGELGISPLDVDKSMSSNIYGDRDRIIKRQREGFMGALSPRQQEIQNNLARLESEYGGQLGLVPQVKDGGVIDSPKIAALKKMRGY